MVRCNNCGGILVEDDYYKDNDDPCVCKAAEELTKIINDSESMLIKMMQ